MKSQTTHCCAPPGGPPAHALFPRGPHAPADARRYVRDVLVHDDDPLGENQLNDILLIVSELVTNAYLHGTGPGGSVLVTVMTTRDTVRIEVDDSGRQRPHVRDASEDRDDGRGLHIVDALAARWDVADRPPGKKVWAEVAR
ncbi:ATP-binding protein [Streptomyces sp. NPDC017520]|uniref:ATP-binding protein n=1 Tax=Streptomyces sp. NPDC017520 TaxID=3364998 RepID=UPI003795CBDD